jgi:shikimate kinase/3-dehydroquinate synthase
VERVVLVGFMGCGKTTVGREVARLLEWDFEDMDHRLEQALGASIAEVFRTRGEAFFRAQEAALARELLGRRRLVVAAGGGAFTVPETREALRAGAVTVWLRCPLEVVLQRVPFDGSRPLARDRATIGRLFDQRASSYRLADRQVDANLGPPAAVAHAVVAALQPGSAQEAETPSER